MEQEALPGVSRRRVIRIGCAVVAVALLTTAGDWYLRNVEMNHLVASIALAEKAEANGDSRIDAAARRLSDDPLGVTTLEPVEKEASADVGPVSDAILRIEDVSVLPWHRSIRHAKTRYLEHAKVWRSYFDGIANGRSVASVQRQISPTFDEAMRALRAAIPRLPLHSLKTRVAAFK